MEGEQLLATSREMLQDLMITIMDLLHDDKILHVLLVDHKCSPDTATYENMEWFTYNMDDNIRCILTTMDMKTEIDKLNNLFRYVSDRPKINCFCPNCEEQTFIGQGWTAMPLFIWAGLNLFYLLRIGKKQQFTYTMFRN